MASDGLSISGYGAMPAAARMTHAGTAGAPAMATGAVAPQQAGPLDGTVDPSRLANTRLGQNWSGVAQGSNYRSLFGDASYVKDGSDPQLLSLLQEALAASPELQGTSLAAAVQRGKVGPDDMKVLQGFLQSKGLSVGATGVDGKFGPRTHGALEAFLRGDARNAAGGNAAGAAPGAAAGAAGVSTPTGTGGALAAAGQTTAAPAPTQGGLARRGRPAPAETGQPAAPPAAAPPQGQHGASIPKGAPGNTGMTAGAPEGYRTLKGRVPEGVTSTAKGLLAGEYGTETPFEIDGKRYLGRVEQHYHPPGYQGGPNGWHKGVTVYEGT